MVLGLVVSSDGGSVAAPAGCGKTQLIANLLRAKTDKPHLVLTHTTAGVAALRKRLADIPSKNYIVMTIAGWALTIAKKFPETVQYSATSFAPPNYRQLQLKVAEVFVRGDLNELVAASYERIYVDEFQDCDVIQFQLISALKKDLPIVVFGDPAQSIFDFGESLPNWDEEVLVSFPLITELSTPWRWENSNSPELGEWILMCREQLLAGVQIDLSDRPACVQWHKLGNNTQENRKNQVAAYYQLSNNIAADETLLVIGSSTNAAERYDFAKRVNGLSVVEPVDLKDVIYAARRFDQLAGFDLLSAALDVLSGMMTNVNGSSVKGRVKTIIEGKHRTPPNILEQISAELVLSSSPASLIKLISAAENQPSTKLFRRDAFFALRDATELASIDSSQSYEACAASVREKRRHSGDRISYRKSIGSTLLLKGLEADHVLILDTENMNARNLYVALSRAAKTLTIFSKQPRLN